MYKLDCLHCWCQSVQSLQSTMFFLFLSIMVTSDSGESCHTSTFSFIYFYFHIEQKCYSHSKLIMKDGRVLIE